MQGGGIAVSSRYFWKSQFGSLRFCLPLAAKRLCNAAPLPMLIPRGSFNCSLRTVGADSWPCELSLELLGGEGEAELPPLSPPPTVKAQGSRAPPWSKTETDPMAGRRGARTSSPFPTFSHWKAAQACPGSRSCYLAGLQGDAISVGVKAGFSGRWEGMVLGWGGGGQWLVGKNIPSKERQFVNKT